ADFDRLIWGFQIPQVVPALTRCELIPSGIPWHGRNFFLLVNRQGREDRAWFTGVIVEFPDHLAPAVQIKDGMRYFMRMPAEVGRIAWVVRIVPVLLRSVSVPEQRSNVRVW